MKVKDIQNMLKGYNENDEILIDCPEVVSPENMDIDITASLTNMRCRIVGETDWHDEPFVIVRIENL
ncbi:MAG: hypothetical protein PUA95_03345 [Lactimicrobium massiliense]|nr:hypothetical protein [Lactimicrobium massiliense]MDD6229750.1 hypothetical protein [Lactimicrobium massiliense]